MKMNIAGLLLFITLTIFAAKSYPAIVADHNGAANFETIPPTYIEVIRSDYHIYYVHTSHGSQIMTGINMLENENLFYHPPYFYEYGDDLGHNGDTTWVPATRTYLDNHPQCNIAMFSWCGGCSDNTEEGINIYLEKMNELEQDYPGVNFIYMTGHLDGTGPSGNLYARNNQIRAYCIANNKSLFDFADIESYDPDGVYYPVETDACNWCYDWCASHSCPGCGGCAHSHCFNCYLKGKAWWWMMARITGWDGGEPVCGDTNGDEVVNILDIVLLIDYLYHGGSGPDSFNSADVNSSGSINLLDVTYLIYYLYKGGPEPVCA
jgi:hypothetical protein